MFDVSLRGGLRSSFVLLFVVLDSGEKMTRVLKTQSQIDAHREAAEQTLLARALRFFRVPALPNVPHCYERDNKTGEWKATAALQSGKSCRAPMGRLQLPPENEDA